jgi:hypothetical protein
MSFGRPGGLFQSVTHLRKAEGRFSPPLASTEKPALPSESLLARRSRTIIGIWIFLPTHRAVG